MTNGVYDIFLEHNGVKEGFKLAKGENGPLYSWALEDALASQRDFNEYGYASEPNDVNQPIHIGDFSGGSGLLQAPPGEQTTESYSYSQGVDLSWPDRVYLSPLRQAGTALNDAPFKVIFTSQGTFGITATELWEWTGSAWTSRLSSVTPTDIAEFEGNIFIAMGSNSYQYTANGTSFTISNLTTKDFSFFTVRSGQDGSAVLWGIDANGSLRPNADPINGGDEWAAAEQIGDTWETITAFVAAEDFLYVFKEEGIYSFDGTLVEDVWPARTLARPTNAKGAFLWTDGLIYLHLDGLLYAFDPGSRDLQQVWPLDERIGHPQLNGSITGLGGDDQHIYFALKNAAGNTYIMKGMPSNEEWHTWTYLGANDCTVVSPQRAGDVDSSNPTVVIGYGSRLSHYILPGANLRPENDASYQFDTGDGFALFPWLDGGAPLYSKFITAARLVTENTAETTQIGTRIARLSYALDGGAQMTELVIANGPGIRIGVPPDAVRFTWVQPKLTLETDVVTDSPVVKALVFDTTPNPPRRRKVNAVLDLQLTAAAGRGGVTTNRAAYLEDFLIGGVSSRILLWDVYGRRLVMKMRSAQQVVDEPKDVIENGQKVAVELFEMGATGYLSTWFGVGAKHLLPDISGGAVGINDDTEVPEDTTEFQGVFRPVVEADHGHWVVAPFTHSFIRFPEVTIPNGATIDRAYMRIRLFAVRPETADPNLSVTITFNDVDDATAPTDAVAAQALVSTTANTAWTATLTAADGFWTWWQTPDLADELQEIVDRAGWAEGGAMQLIGKQNAVTGDFWSRFFGTVLFANSVLDTVPELVVEWTV